MAGDIAEPTRRQMLRLLGIAAGWAGGLTLGAGPAAASDEGDALLVAAASSLRFVLPALGAQSGRAIEPVYASSGDLARQIVAGAPFGVFMSADPSFADRVVAASAGAPSAGATRAGPTEAPLQVVPYARGRLVLVLTGGSDLRGRHATAAETLRTGLAAGHIQRVAIASPAHAPYGMRAREALEALGLWPELMGERRLLVAPSVAQALQFATAGGAEAAIVGDGLVAALAETGQLDPADSQRIDPALYTPLTHVALALAAGGATGRAFVAHLRSPAAQAILAEAGFQPLGP